MKTDGMTDEQQTLLLIRGAIASLPVEKQTKVQIVYKRIHDLAVEFGVDEAMLAVALVGAEVAAQP